MRPYNLVCRYQRVSGTCCLHFGILTLGTTVPPNNFVTCLPRLHGVTFQEILKFLLPWFCKNGKVSVSTITPVCQHHYSCLLAPLHLSVSTVTPVCQHHYTCLLAPLHLSVSTITPVCQHRYTCLLAPLHLSVSTVTPVCQHHYTCLLAPLHLSTIEPLAWREWEEPFYQQVCASECDYTSVTVCLSVTVVSRKGGYTLVILPRIVTPYRDSVDESRPHRHDTVLRYAVTLRVCTHLNGGEFLAQPRCSFIMDSTAT